jgi:hypothetical protein
MIFKILLVVHLIPLLPGNMPVSIPEGDEHRVYGEWELDRNSNGVKSYVRWIQTDSSEKVRERMGVMQMNCSMDEAMKFLSDTKNAELWMAGIKENYRLKQINQSEWYAYTLFNIPWPFEKRDLVSIYHLESSDGNKKSTIHIISRENFIPEKAHITRLTDYTASWTIVGIDENKVSVSFSAIANTPPMFPRYIQDPILSRMFHNNLVNLKKMLDS